MTLEELGFKEDEELSTRNRKLFVREDGIEIFFSFTANIFGITYLAGNRTRTYIYKPGTVVEMPVYNLDLMCAIENQLRMYGMWGLND